MPIKDCPFTNCGNNIYRPLLPIRIINPYTGKGYNTFGLIDTGAPLLPIRIINPYTRKGYKTFGLIDTGADDCAVPSVFAPIL